MAISGTEPVSVDNLAAAIGAEVVGTDEFGQRPVCVDNLKAAMREMSGQKLVEYVICDGNNSATANTTSDPSGFKLLIVYIRFMGVGTRDETPIVVMNPKIGTNYADMYTVSIKPTSVSANLQDDWIIQKIRAFR